MNRFIIKNNQLLLKTLRHNEIVVAPNIDQKTLLTLATDLLTVTLNYKKISYLPQDFIFASTNERKFLDLASRGIPDSKIAKNLGLHPNSIKRIKRRIMQKIDKLYELKRPQEQPKRLDLYEKIQVQTIPFSTILTTDEEGEEVEFEFGDDNKASDEIYRELDRSTKIEDSDAYRVLKYTKQRQLAKLLSEGKSYHECALAMKVGDQAIYQMAGRIRKELRNAKIHA